VLGGNGGDWGRGGSKQADHVGVSANLNLLAKFKQQRDLEGVALRQRASRQGQNKIQQKQTSKKLTWLTYKYLLESFFMDLMVNAPERSEL
jgi:hypothetical protein